MINGDKNDQNGGQKDQIEPLKLKQKAFSQQGSGLIFRSLAFHVILDFLPKRAAVKMQILCRKLYDDIIPQYFKQIPMPINPKFNKFCHFDFDRMELTKLRFQGQNEADKLKIISNPERITIQNAYTKFA